MKKSYNYFFIDCLIYNLRYFFEQGWKAEDEDDVREKDGFEVGMFWLCELVSIAVIYMKWSVDVELNEILPEDWGSQNT